MGTEILPEVCFSPAPSSFDRPFRIHVQDRTFLIDAERKTQSCEISASNFALILRLSHKYQVLPVIDACQDFIKRTDLYVLSPDDILTLLMAAYEFHCKREVLVLLIRRLATEGNAVFARLKISRFLPAQDELSV
ncbi:hypothetical protein ANCCEY_00698 [Ancylostoma ceylanicum]|uniref:BTB domain-containing protein n=1 Tax=Ancylostoma ceylanicum TaxID=53326 RepID=A0A0D6M9G6_9BILA|nr:hypothetical protein ANCCEY_00698 [Ancylostoma ceylanicum]